MGSELSESVCNVGNDTHEENALSLSFCPFILSQGLLLPLPVLLRGAVGTRGWHSQCCDWGHECHGAGTASAVFGDMGLAQTVLCSGTWGWHSLHCPNPAGGCSGTVLL